MGCDCSGCPGCEPDGWRWCAAHRRKCRVEVVEQHRAAVTAGADPEAEAAQGAAPRAEGLPSVEDLADALERLKKAQRSPSKFRADFEQDARFILARLAPTGAPRTGTCPADQVVHADHRGVDVIELEYLRKIMDANERQSFQAKLEDMGEDNCDVCRSNRLRDAWESDEQGPA